MIELDIPDVCPSLNRQLRMHWSQRKRLVDLWRRWVWVACVQAKIPTRHPLSFAKIEIHRVGKKAMDPDNLVGAQKVLIDGLRSHGLIVDDTPEHITLTVTQAKSKVPRTVVRIS